MQESVYPPSFYDAVEQLIPDVKTARKGVARPRHRTTSRGVSLRWRQVNTIQTDTEDHEISDKVISQFELYKQSRAEWQKQEAEKERETQEEEALPPTPNRNSTAEQTDYGNLKRPSGAIASFLQVG